jgi:tRNA threonylcarbamoyl adenosine modification protein YeaZ
MPPSSIPSRPGPKAIRILALDAALASCSAGLVVDDVCIAARTEHGARRHAALAPMVDALMPGRLDLVAVTVGPGSFTGLRAAIALAHGIALGAGVPVVAVTVAEALADALPALAGRALWVAIDSRRNRVFLQRDGMISSVALDDLPRPAGAVAIAGDAAREVASRLAARGHDVMLTNATTPMPRHIAVVGRRRANAELSPLPVLPTYIDPPEARESQLRPPPAE